MDRPLLNAVIQAASELVGALPRMVVILVADDCYRLIGGLMPFCNRMGHLGRAWCNGRGWRCRTVAAPPVC